MAQKLEIMENVNPQAQDLSSVTGAQAPQAAQAPGATASAHDAAEKQALKSLKIGDTLLVKARGVNGDKVELEFAEHISNPYNTGSSSSPLIGMLNKSDDRFNQSGGPRRAWVTGTKSDISELLGMDVSGLVLGEILSILKVNPEINGIKLKLQVNETIQPDAYQAENIEKTAKKRGANGEFITHKGMYIFANVTVIPSNEEVEHTFLEPDRKQVQGIMAVQSSAAVSAGVSAPSNPQGLAV